MFGDERLTHLLESQHHPTAQSTVDAILQAVTDFQAGTAHFDDETIVVLHALEPPVPSH
jgi:sigma-B regulation protein RsbU (phosphoserine phosphatase)